MPLISSHSIHISSTDHHLRRELEFYNNIKQDFVFDTGSPVSLICLQFFKRHFSDTTVQQYNSEVTGVTGHKVVIRGKVQIQLANATLLSFLLIPQQLFILGLDNLKTLNFDYKMSLQCNTSSISDDINLLISKLGSTSGGIKMSPVSFQISGQPMFCKSRSIALDI